MNKVKISPVSINQASPLSELCKTTFEATYAKHNTAEDMNNYLATYFNLARIQAEITNPLIHFYMAWFADEPVAYVKLNLTGAQTDINDGESLEIERIYVLPKMQGQKIGLALLNQTKALAKSLDLAYIWLGVWQKNTKAIQFYKHQGFIKFGEHTFILGEDEQLDDLMKLSI